MNPEQIQTHPSGTHLPAVSHDVLVFAEVSHALLTEVRIRVPDAIILLPGRHLVAHLAHRDLERQLRHHTDVPILAVTAKGSPHLV